MKKEKKRRKNIGNAEKPSLKLKPQTQILNKKISLHQRSTKSSYTMHHKQKEMGGSIRIGIHHSPDIRGMCAAESISNIFTCSR